MDKQAKPGRQRGRKAVSLNVANGYRTPQDCIWESIRTLKEFTKLELEIHLVNRDKRGINDYTIKSYLNRLLKGEYVVVIDKRELYGNAKVFTYRLLKDMGVHAPRLAKNGKITTQGVGRTNMWRSMSALPSFDYKDLVDTASAPVKPAEAKDYIKHLYRSGYLTLIKKGNPASPARYKLLPTKYTGPLSPMVQRIKRVFDPNLNKVVWPADINEGLEQ